MGSNQDLDEMLRALATDGAQVPQASLEFTNEELAVVRAALEETVSRPSELACHLLGHWSELDSAERVSGLLVLAQVLAHQPD